MSFAALLAGLLKNNYDIEYGSQKNFNALGKIIVKVLEPYVSISKMSTFYKFGATLSDIQRISAALESKGTPSEDIPDFYNSAKSNDEGVVDATLDNSDKTDKMIYAKD